MQANALFGHGQRSGARGKIDCDLDSPPSRSVCQKSHDDKHLTYFEFILARVNANLIRYVNQE